MRFGILCVRVLVAVVVMRVVAVPGRGVAVPIED